MVLGFRSELEGYAAKMKKELRALGLDKIRAELIKQVQAYLDKGGK
jgi:hypothetical protein